MALGRENAVHLALTDARAADRVLAHLSRWQFFTGWSRDATNRDSDPHASPTAGEENIGAAPDGTAASDAFRSEEQPSELQSLMRLTYAVFGLKTTKHNRQKTYTRYILQ